MSLYNIINEFNPASFFILPMLGKHPEEYPRFRDCFLKDEYYPEYDNMIHVYTRTGGGNRESYEDEILEMKGSPYYVADHDDSFDSTYATFVFNIPDQYKSDFDILTGNVEGKGIKDISETYKNHLYKVFPKLKEQLDSIFNN